MPLTNCDVCDSTSSELFRTVGVHEYKVCNKCGTIYLPTRLKNLAKSNKVNHTYLDDTEGYAKIINPHGTRYMAGNVDYWYEKKVGAPKGRLLEIGAGMGFLAYTLFARDWDVEAIELSDVAINWQSKYFKLPMQKAMVEDYTNKDYSAVVLVEVLEHIYNPLEGLKKIKSMLVSGGMIFGTTPNTGSKHWKISEQDIYDPTDHIVLFNSRSLRMILEKAGYKNISIQTFGSGENNDSNLMYAAVKPKAIKHKTKLLAKKILRK